MKDDRSMQVLLANPRGFCAGVERAIEIVEKALEKYGRPVYVRHDIVHNKTVVERFERQGVVFVDDIVEVPPGRPIMLSAHGSAPDVVEGARARGSFVVDSVCPLVTKVHHEARVRAGKGYTILYVGHEGHDEAEGALAVAPDAMRLVEHESDLDRVLPTVDDAGKVALLAQTTLSMDDWNGVLTRAREHFPELWTASRDDLCFATTNRQRALRALVERADAIVVIGSANSSNTIALTKVARAAGCERVLRVDGPEELDRDALGDARVVGVTAGASAPEDLVHAVIAELAPTEGVEMVHVTDEDEYFPPPRNIRELQAAIGTASAALLGASVSDSALMNDNELAASNVLAALRAS